MVIGYFQPGRMVVMIRAVGRGRNRDHRLFGTTRGKVLVMLCYERQTVDQLAERLRLTRNAVRAQIERLERDGLVAKAGFRRGVRKPHVEYELSLRALELFPRAYEPALVRIMDVLTHRLGAGASRDILHEAARRLLRDHLGELRGRTPRQRIAESVKKLNGQSLGVDVSEQSGKTVIRSCSCPLASLVATHPEVCGLFASVLGDLLGMKVSESCQKGESARCCFECTAN